MLVLLPYALAATCDAPIYSVLAEPSLPASGPGVNSGTTTLEGQSAVGVRFLHDSTAPASAWQAVLHAAETQDDWVPDQFGYDLVERLDSGHLYLRFDVGLLWGKVHVRRQLVVKTTEETSGTRYRTCWSRIDPAPYLAQIAGWVREGVEWEAPSTGWWEVTPTATGARIGYQWWSVASNVPPAIQVYGVKQTLPALLAAFDAQARKVAGK